MPTKITDKSDGITKTNMSNEHKKSSLQGYLTKGLGRGGGISEEQGKRAKDLVGGNNPKGRELTDDIRNAYYKERMTVEYNGEKIDIYNAPDVAEVEMGCGNEKEGGDIQREVQSEQRKTAKLVDGTTPVQSSQGVDYSGEKPELMSGEVGERGSEKETQVMMEVEEDNQFLVDEAVKMVQKEMEAEAMKVTTGGTMQEKGIAKYSAFWEKKAVELEKAVEAGKVDDPNYIQKMRNYIEKKIKESLLRENKLGESNDARSKHKKQKKEEDSSINVDVDNEVEIIGVAENTLDDISDDETVVTSTSAKNSGDGEWKIVTSKMKKKTEASKKSPIVSVLRTSKNQRYKVQKKIVITENNRTKNDNRVTNSNLSYKTSDTTDSETRSENEKQAKLPTFMEMLKKKKRKENQYQVRLNFSFTPRSATKGEIKRIAVELMQIAVSIDEKVLLLPWENVEDSVDMGPINLEDLANPSAYVKEIIKYIHKPKFVNLIPGQTAYKMGFRVSTTMHKYKFLRMWNSSKQRMKDYNSKYYTVTFAPMQNSAEAFMIGMAAGSSEDQDLDLLNKKLAEVTGIRGIEASFQNVNQKGITNDFWRIANEKAEATMSYKNSREYLRCKYRWAPNAIVFYVPKADMVVEARKKMIQMYGKEAGKGDSKWPDGTEMRFLPLKEGIIRSERTRTIVKKRLAYHIWLKAHDKVMLTRFCNIHGGENVFGGSTFAEKFLSMAKDESTGKSLFRHFKRGWNADPSKETWLLAVAQDNVAKANEFLRSISDKLIEEYGEDAEQFCDDKRVNYDTGYLKEGQDDDDDNWFQDDDIDGMIKSGVLKSDFIQFLKGESTEEDKESVLSWGTGETNYTELETVTRASMSQEVSSITNDFLTAKEILDRREAVKSRLKNIVSNEKELTEIMEQQHPYELVMSGIELPTWNIETEVLMITAFREQINKPNMKK